MVKRFIPYLLAFIVLLIDQASKWVVKKNFSYVTNTGAGFGIFQNHPLRLMLVAATVAAFLLIYLWKHPSLELGILLGGTLGNLTDRLVRGHVIDFITIGAWPSFNLADAANTLAVLAILLRTRKKNQYR